VPIIQRRQLLGVLVVQQRELRQYDESEESFLVTLATQMAAILSQSQLAALFGQYRHTRIRALPASPGVAIAEGWMDATLPLMEQVYEASTLDEALERERLTAALEEAANEFRRYSKRFAAGAQKRRRPSLTSIRTCFPTRVCAVSFLRKWIKARSQSGRLRRSSKNLPINLRH
jgi:phosphotransferase system enzyme I (PtsP)